jgi:hypothetical protein
MEISKRKMILPSCSTNTRYRFQKHFWNRTENRFFSFSLTGSGTEPAVPIPVPGIFWNRRTLSVKARQDVNIIIPQKFEKKTPKISVVLSTRCYFI